jgi:replicative DNA helicase
MPKDYSKTNRFNNRTTTDNLMLDIGLGKIPPQATDIEEAVLGALMLEKDAIEEVFPLLQPETFYRDSHQKIYTAIQYLYKENKPIDILTVTEYLKSQSQIEEVGGAYYISILTSKVASASHIYFHSLVLKEKFFFREMIKFSQQLSTISFDDDVDPDDVIEKASNDFQNIIEGFYGFQQEKSFRNLLVQAKDEYFIRQELAKENKLAGIETPIKDLTNLMNGWQDAEVTVVAARPSMGKTAFLLSCLIKAASTGKNAAVFSLEMPGVRLTDRLICGHAGLDPNKYKKGLLNTEELERFAKTIQELWDLGIYIDDESTVSIDYIRNKSKSIKRKYGLDIIFIDYLQLMSSSHVKGRSREQEVADMSRKIKLLSKELNVPVIILAQLNRQCELRGGDKRPVLSDLRESGALEQDADNVILIYRAAYYKFLEDSDGNSTKGKGELIVAKQRNGNIDTIAFGHNESLTRIYDWLPADQMADMPNESTYKQNMDNAEGSFVQAAMPQNIDFDNQGQLPVIPF